MPDSGASTPTASSVRLSPSSESTIRLGNRIRFAIGEVRALGTCQRIEPMMVDPRGCVNDLFIVKQERSASENRAGARHRKRQAQDGAGRVLEKADPSPWYLAIRCGMIPSGDERAVGAVYIS